MPIGKIKPQHRASADMIARCAAMGDAESVERTAIAICEHIDRHEANGEHRLADMFREASRAVDAMAALRFGRAYWDEHSPARKRDRARGL